MMATLSSGDLQRNESPLGELLGKKSVPEKLLDILRAVIPAAGSFGDLALPGLGATLSVTSAALVEGVRTPTFERRVIRYLENDLIPRLEALVDRVDNLEERIVAPIVTDIGYQTTRAAGLTGDARKHEYLALAVVAVLADGTWDSRAERTRMLSRVHVEIPTSELRFLELFADPRGWQERHHQLVAAPGEDGRIRLSTLMLAAFPDIEETPAWSTQR